MAIVGTMVARLHATTTQFRKEMSTAQKKLEQTAAAAEGASTAIAAAFAVVGAAAITAGGAAIKMAAQWEQTEIAFATMLKSGEEARAFLEELDKFAAVTPFELPGLIDASRKLLAFGFRAEDIIPIMGSIGDAVAALGGGEFEINRVTRALGQMQAKGKVTAQEMSLQLAEIGIPAWQYLADAIGTDIPQAMKLVEQRMVPASVGIQAILAGMTKDFGNSMALQSQTMIGVWSTAKDQVRVVARATGAYLIEAFDLKGVVAGFSAAVGNLSDQIRQAITPAEGIRTIFKNTFTPGLRLAIVGIAGAIGGALVPAFLTLKKAIWSATLALAPFILKGMVVALGAYTIYRAWSDAGGKIAAVSVFMVRMVAAVVGALGVVIPPLRGVAAGMNAYANSVAATSKPVAALTGALSEQQKDIAKVGGQAAAAQEELGKSVEEAAKRAGGSVLAFDQVHRLQEEMAGPAAAIQMPDVAAAMALPALTMPDMTAATSPLAAMAEGWDKINAAMQRVTPTLTAVGHLIGVFLVFKTGLLIAKWVVLGAQSMLTAGKVAAAWLLMQAKAIASVAVQVAQFVMLIAKWVVLGAQSMLAAGKVAAAWVVALGPVGWVIATVAGLVVAVIANWETIRATTVRVWGGITAFLGNAWVGISASAETLRSTLAATWGAVRSTAERIWTGIVNAIRGAVNSIIGAINSFIRGINRIQISVPAVTIPLIGRVGGFTVGMPQIPEIPRLAQGTNFVPQDTLAWLHRGEAVVPKKYVSEGGDIDAIADAVGNAVLFAMQAALREREQGSRQEVVLEIDGRKLGRVMLDSLRGEEMRTGTRLVVV